MTDWVNLDDRLLALRREFDQTFALADGTPDDPSVQLLGITVAGHAYAFPLSDVRGLLANRPLVPLPTSVPSFAGVIGHRSMVVPVFDLAALLGYPAPLERRWIALVGTSDLPIGMSFEHFDAQLSVPRDSGQAPPPGEPGHDRYVSHAVLSDGKVRSVLNVPALLDALPRTSMPARKE